MVWPSLFLLAYCRVNCRANSPAKKKGLFETGQRIHYRLESELNALAGERLHTRCKDLTKAKAARMAGILLRSWN